MILSLTLGIFIIILWLAHHAYGRWIHFQIFENQGIPGPSPSFITGNLIALRKSRRFICHVYDDWEKQYGDLYGYFTGFQSTLVIRDLDLVKEILVKHSVEHFSKRMTPMVKVKPLMSSLVGLEVERWREIRSMLTPSFSVSKMRQMSHLMNVTTIEILREKSGQELNVLSLFQGLSCEVISVCALAMKVNSQWDSNDTFLVTVREFMQNAMTPLLYPAICFPSLARIFQYVVETFAVSAKMTNIVCQNVQNVIDSRRRRQRQRQSQTTRNDSMVTIIDSESNPKDILQRMMDAAENTSFHCEKMTDEEIIANSWIFLLGGFETSSSALTFISYLLATHPDVQQSLYKELKATFFV
jgi:cytochrome P450